MENKFNFKPIQPKRFAGISEVIGIMKNGGFSFLSTFYKEKKIGDYKYLQLNYDKDKQAIAFLFTNNGEISGVYTISHKSKRNAVVISTSFWKQINLNPIDFAGKYKPYLYQEDGQNYHYILLMENKNEKNV